MTLPRPRPLAPWLLVAVAGLATSACTRDAIYKSQGSVAPTVSGSGQGAAFASPEAARAAFSRSNGPLTAVLEDASWIRLEADPHNAQERHPDYFRGLTVFFVQLYNQNFMQPTEETYLLEDSTGARVTAKPDHYKAEVTKGMGAKFYSEFTLVFPHTMSKDVRWIRLTRQAEEGGTVTWQFPD